MDSQSKKPNRWVWGCVGFFVILCSICGICQFVPRFEGNGEPSATQQPESSRQRQVSPVQTEDAELSSGSDCRINYINSYPEKGTYLPDQTVFFQGETISCERISVTIRNKDSNKMETFVGSNNYVAADWDSPNGSGDFEVCIYGWDSDEETISQCHNLALMGPPSYSMNGVTIVDGGGNCQNAYPPSLIVGREGIITDGPDSTLWPLPGSRESNNQRMAYIPAGTKFSVVGNPICTNAEGYDQGHIWWPVIARSDSTWDIQMQGLPLNEDILGYISQGQINSPGAPWAELQ